MAQPSTDIDLVFIIVKTNEALSCLGMRESCWPYFIPNQAASTDLNLHCYTLLVNVVLTYKLLYISKFPAWNIF